jgi:hypothetical protein
MTGPDITFLARFGSPEGVPDRPGCPRREPGRLPGLRPGAQHAVLSRRIPGDLMDAGWTPPEVTR